MCGIAGIYNINKKPVDEALLLAMTQKMHHRGPDDTGIFLENNVGLGHARLSIIDLSQAGHQPMKDDAANLYIVFNGEIYNFKELRSELESLGHIFISKTDTEVILNGYKEWGTDCVKKFNGMFAFAIFDKKQQQIFLARDRMGEKPLYYYLDGNTFMFASEIKVILENKNVRRSVDSQGLVNYFTFGHSIAPDTIYAGIKKLLPGYSATFKDGKLQTNQYWDVSLLPPTQDKGEQYYCDGIKNILQTSVDQRLISDVPLGVFLSGGIDSSLIVAMMAKNQASPIKTFSVGFDFKDKEFNELSDAKIVADYFKTDHHQIILKETDLIDALKNIVFHFDEPFADAANFPLFCMSQFAKKHVSVVLAGEGGDEIFGGYRRYVIEKYNPKLPWLSAIFANPIIKSFFNTLPSRRLKRIASALAISDDLLRYTSWISFFSDDMIKQLFKTRDSADPLKVYRQQLSLYKSDDWLSTIMRLDQKVLLPDGYLEKVDKATMAFGLEARAPFLDHNLVEFANQIPSKYKIKGLQTKSILRKVAADFLPESIYKKSKHGFAVPINLWLKGGLKQYALEILFDQKTRQRGYFNFDYIEKIYKEYCDNGKSFDYQLWQLVNFELWHRQFIDK